MNYLEVTCINKDDRMSKVESITHIGGRDWRKSKYEAIREIENLESSFYVSSGSNRVDVVIGIRNGNKYLKTKPDGENTNNLLSLPECR